MNSFIFVALAMLMGLLGQFVVKNKASRRKLTWTFVISVSALCFLGKVSQAAFCVLGIGSFVAVALDLFDLRGQKQI